MNIWIAAIPALILAAVAAIGLLRRNKRGGVAILAGVNVVVLLGSLVVLVLALTSEPAAAGAVVAQTGDEVAQAGIGGTALIAAAIAVAGSSLGAAFAEIGRAHV